MTPDVPVRWSARAGPLVPTCLAAFGPTAQAVARRLLLQQDERLAELRAVSIADGLVLLGSTEHLPWLPGVVYLGVDPRAPDLRLPTHSQPDVPVELLDAAVRNRCPRLPAAVLPEQALVVPLDEARALSRDALTRWLSGPQGA